MIDFDLLQPDCPVVATPHCVPDWEICHGLVLASSISGQYFSSYARLAPSFRAPTDGERRRFRQAGPTARHAFATVVPVDLRATETLRRYALEFRRGCGNEVAAQEATQQILASLRAVLNIEGDVEILRPGPERARQLGNTLSGSLPGAPRAGLHVDAWRHTLARDHHPDGFFTEPNRALVNLGPQERWLHWIPFSFHLVAHLLQFDRNRREGGSALLEQIAPKVPVLRLRVPAATAYVAPYEAVFHDGSTITATEQGFGLPLIGSFNLNPCAPAGPSSKRVNRGAESKSDRVGSVDDPATADGLAVPGPVQLVHPLH